MNFNVNLNTFGLDCQECDLVSSASDIPSVIGEISALLLKVGNGCELSGLKLHLTLLSVKGELLNEIAGPLLLLLIPHTNFNVIIFCSEDIFWQGINRRNRVNGDLRGWIWIRDANELVLNRFDLSH